MQMMRNWMAVAIFYGFAVAGIGGGGGGGW